MQELKMAAVQAWQSIIKNLAMRIHKHAKAYTIPHQGAVQFTLCHCGLLIVLLMLRKEARPIHSHSPMAYTLSYNCFEHHRL